jgi:endonuclease/exonuclease/phosphatase family metal-dependent hydrolase
VTSGNVPLGSGLNTLSRYNWNAFDRVTWDQCFINEADCLTPKGFTFMRLELASGVEVDLYNLHADAGDEEGDKDARRGDDMQLLAYINAHSAGRAVVIAGDMNDRYTESGRSIDVLINAGFQDAWIELVNGGVAPTAGSANIDCNIPAGTNNCEDVDKIL